MTTYACGAGFSNTQACPPYMACGSKAEAPKSKCCRLPPSGPPVCAFISTRPVFAHTGCTVRRNMPRWGSYPFTASRKNTTVEATTTRAEVGSNMP